MLSLSERSLLTSLCVLVSTLAALFLSWELSLSLSSSCPRGRCLKAARARAKGRETPGEAPEQ